MCSIFSRYYSANWFPGSQFNPKKSFLDSCDQRMISNTLYRKAYSGCLCLASHQVYVLVAVHGS